MSKSKKSVLKSIHISLLLILTVMFVYFLVVSIPFVASANSVWTTPVIVPTPVSVTGVSTPVVSLDGMWKFTLTPPADFWQNSVDPSSWPDIQVPGECAMQGFNV